MRPARAPSPRLAHAPAPLARPARTALLLLATVGSLWAARIPNTTQLKIVCQDRVNQLCLTWPIAVEEVQVAVKKLHRTPPQYLCGISADKTILQDYKEILVYSPGNVVTTCKSIIHLPMDNLNNWSLKYRKGSRQRRQVPYRGRFRGQTQSQYLAIDQGSGKDEGKAEAISAADTSKAVVSGRSGMGQAQSQSMYDPSCDECVDRYVPGVENLKRPIESARERTPVSGYNWNRPGGQGERGPPGAGSSWNTPGERPAGLGVTDRNTQGGSPGQNVGSTGEQGGSPVEGNNWNSQDPLTGLPEGRSNWNLNGAPGGQGAGPIGQGSSPGRGTNWNAQGGTPGSQGGRPGGQAGPSDSGTNWNMQEGTPGSQGGRPVGPGGPPNSGTNWNMQEGTPGSQGGSPGGPKGPTNDRSNWDMQGGSPGSQGGRPGGPGGPLNSGTNWNTQGSIPGSQGGRPVGPGGPPNGGTNWNTQGGTPGSQGGRPGGQIGPPDGGTNWNMQGGTPGSQGGRPDGQGGPRDGGNNWNTVGWPSGRRPDEGGNWSAQVGGPGAQREGSNWNSQGGAPGGQGRGPGVRESLPGGTDWNSQGGNPGSKGGGPNGQGGLGGGPQGSTPGFDGGNNWNPVKGEGGQGGGSNWNPQGGGQSGWPGGDETAPVNSGSWNNVNQPPGVQRGTPTTGVNWGSQGPPFLPPFLGKDWSLITGPLPGVKQGSTYFCCVVGPNTPQFIETGGNVSGNTSPTVFNMQPIYNPKGLGGGTGTPGGQQEWPAGQVGAPGEGWNAQTGTPGSQGGWFGGQGGPPGGSWISHGGSPDRQGNAPWNAQRGLPSGPSGGRSEGKWNAQGNNREQGSPPVGGLNIQGGSPVGVGSGGQGGGLSRQGGPQSGGWDRQGGLPGYAWIGQGSGPGNQGEGSRGQSGPSRGSWNGQEGAGEGQGGGIAWQGDPLRGGWNSQGTPTGSPGGTGGQTGPAGGGWNTQNGAPVNQIGGPSGQRVIPGEGWSVQGGVPGGQGGGSAVQRGPSGGGWNTKGGGSAGQGTGPTEQGGPSKGGWNAEVGAPGGQRGQFGGQGGPLRGGWNSQGGGPGGQEGPYGGQGVPSGGGWNVQGGGPGGQGGGSGGQGGLSGGGWNAQGGGPGGPGGETGGPRSTFGGWNAKGGPGSQGGGYGGQGGPSGWNAQGGEPGGHGGGSGGQRGPSGGGWNAQGGGPGGHGEGSGRQGGPLGGGWNAQGGGPGGPGGETGWPHSTSGDWNAEVGPGSQGGGSGGQGGPSGGGWNAQGGEPGGHGGGSGGARNTSGGWNAGGPDGQGRGSGGQGGPSVGGWDTQGVPGGRGGDSGGQGGNVNIVPSANETQGPPQNVIDPNSIVIEGDDSQAESSITQNANGTMAVASSNGGNDKGRAKTQVSGTYAGSGTFSAQAEISDESKGAQSEVSGGKHGAISIAQGHSRNSKSQANVNLGSETGSLTSGAQSDGVMHSSNTQVQGGVKGGSAEAQARGPGSTSSQAQIGFTPFKDSDKTQHDQFKTPFVGAGKASSHSNGRIGESQSQLEGSFKYGIKYTGAAQAGASLNKDAVFASRLPFNKIDVFDKNDVNIKVDNTEKPLDLKPLPLPNINDVPNNIVNTTEKPQVKSEGKMSDHTHLDHHLPSNANRAAPTSPPPSGNTRSFHPTYATNNADFDYTSDKEDNTPEDYDTEGGFGPEGSDPVDGEYNYDDFGKDTETHQSLYSPNRKSFEVKQSSGGNTQHIVLDALNGQDAVITQRNTEDKPDESRIYQPGESVPGTGGYTIPIGFTGSVQSLASKQNTYAIGSRRSPSQAQTVSLTPGSGKVKYVYPNPNVSPYGKYVAPKDLRSFSNNNKDDSNRYVSVSKTVTGALDSENNIRKQYSHTYYTKSSSCGYFTFTCTMVSSPKGRKKVCKPKIPINPDGTPMRC